MESHNDPLILKSLPVHHLCKHIIWIFPKWSLWYQFCFSNKDTPLETFMVDSKMILTKMVNKWRLFEFIS